MNITVSLSKDYCNLQLSWTSGKVFPLNTQGIGNGTRTINAMSYCLLLRSLSPIVIFLQEIYLTVKIVLCYIAGGAMR